MSIDSETKIITIDASGERLGRLASRIAMILRGKNNPGFVPNKSPLVKVHIINASKLKVAPEKPREKTYTRYSGYPGGLKKESLGHLVARKGYAEALRHAVHGMLPRNTLRKRILKNLIIKEKE